MERPKRKSLAQLEKQVTTFNNKYSVGDLVNCEMGDGTIKPVIIKEPASVLGGHSSVGWFNEISGCYSLDKIQP